ncbi:MAG: YgiQ family radical SAM protein [Promethearchaeota archaeon]
MISTDPKKKPFDVILVSGDYWADHPHSGIGVIARVLEADGFRIGIIEKPDWHSTKDLVKFGLPKLFYGISSGAIDSMLQNYTPLKKLRSEDPYNPFSSEIPDRAIIVYSQLIKRAQKELSRENSVPIILGGVEASLRRFTHYDYWDNKIRRPILFDSKADLIVYGPGEYQAHEIAFRLKNKQTLEKISGTCVISKKKIAEFQELKFREKKFEILPSYTEVRQDKKSFCRMQMQFSNQRNLVQQIDNRVIVQYRMHDYTSKELDELYELPFTYRIPDKFKEFQMTKFSIITHRGCFGNCSFCSIALHQGTKIISRSIGSILSEIERMTHFSDFKGYISDIGGPSANMYGMDCPNAPICEKNCIDCSILNRSHDKVLELLQKSRKIKGIKKTFVRSGIRYDLAIDHEEYLKELSKYHISGNLKIAPEHFSPKICALMNKPNERFDEFKKKFDEMNKTLKQHLKYYFITAHPGSTMKDVYFLRDKLEELGFQNTESIQIFTPTPMSVSTCMYYTGLNPYTLKPVYVPYTYNEKKKQKNVLYPNLSVSKNHMEKRENKKNKK